MIDDGGQRPAGERGRLSLEHDERVLAVTLADFAQRQRRGPEPPGTRASRLIRTLSSGRLRLSTLNAAPADTCSALAATRGRE